MNKIPHNPAMPFTDRSFDKKPAGEEIPVQFPSDSSALGVPLAPGVPLRDAICNAKLLIVDDEYSNVDMLTDMLTESGFTQIESTQNPYEVLHLYNNYAPDLLLLDLMMAGMDGFSVMKQLQEATNGCLDTPILVLTADVSPSTKRQALAIGARDFLVKPFDAVELLLRIENLLEMRFLHQSLRQQNATLEERVQERTASLEAAQQELEAAHCEMLERLALAGEYRDDDTGQHTQRVGRITSLLAKSMGFPDEQVQWVQQAARLHDVGKIGISDLILLKPGKLTEEEFILIKTHTTIGAALFEGGKAELTQIAQRIALSHHERWDGRGYPQGLSGEEIPIEARLLSVADVFDALTHDRPYKKAWPVKEAVAEIEKQSGQQFDAQVVAAFLTLPHHDLI